MSNIEENRCLNKNFSRFLILSALMILLLFGIIWSCSVGALKLDFEQFFSLLFNQEPSTHYKIITEIRVPRILLGVMVGSALAVAGTLLQSVLHNPLASPGIIGISAGAGLSGIILLLALPNLVNFLVPAAFLGALSSAGLVWVLAWRGNANPVRLILSGVALSAMLSAMSSAIMFFNSERAGGILDFTIGSLTAKGWDECDKIWIYVIGGLFVAMWLAKELNVLALGDDVASALGVRVNFTRFCAVAVAALLAAAAVSVAGLLGFVGLIAPHIVRIVIGSDLRFLLPGAALFGGFLVVVCDTLGRIVMEPAELPVGVIMALLGGAFFLWLLRRRLYEA